MPFSQKPHNRSSKNPLCVLLMMPLKCKSICTIKFSISQWQWPCIATTTTTEPMRSSVKIPRIQHNIHNDLPQYTALNLHAWIVKCPMTNSRHLALYNVIISLTTTPIVISHSAQQDHGHHHNYMPTTQQQPFYSPLSATTRVSQYQKKHSPTRHPDHHQSLSASFIYHDL